MDLDLELKKGMETRLKDCKTEDEIHAALESMPSRVVATNLDVVSKAMRRLDRQARSMTE